MQNRITELFNIKYPIIQGGMIWCSGWRLVAAVSNAGGLGLIGSGSMTPNVLREQIQKTKKTTNKPFGVNVPLLYSHTEEIMKVIIEEGVKIVFTSAGNPKIWTKHLQENGIKVAHVIANSKFAIKCDQAGVDSIVAEGFEAGGHNGREETTTMVLIPSIAAVTDLPIIAAGGIATGKAMLASIVLGAEGVQIGSRFVASVESSAHDTFKQEVINAIEGSTMLTLKQITPVRLIKNDFFDKIDRAQIAGESKDRISELLGHGRAKVGMYDGNKVDGELEIGQVAAIIKDILPVNIIINNILTEYNNALDNVSSLNNI